jgi:hypothetical protein
MSKKPKAKSHKSISILILSLVYGSILTGLTFFITQKQPTICASSDLSCEYTQRGFPLKYYQDHLPAGAYNPGGPNFKDQAAADAYYKQYVGVHIYEMELAEDLIIWSGLAAITSLTFRKIRSEHE